MGAYATQRAVGTDMSEARRSETRLALSYRQADERIILDGTLEPDEIPGLSQSSDYFDSDDASELSDRLPFAPDDKPISVGGPVRNTRQATRLANEAAKTKMPDLTSGIVATSVREHSLQHPLQQPQRFRADESTLQLDGKTHFDEDGDISLVQYRSGGRLLRGRTPQTTQQRTAQQQQTASTSQNTDAEPQNSARPVTHSQSQGQSQSVQSAGQSRRQNSIFSWQQEQQPQSQPAKKQPEVAKEPEPKLPAEHPTMLKRSIQATLKSNVRRPLTTQHNSPCEVLCMALPYGADARVYQPSPNANPRDRQAPKGSYIYSIGTLCWNYPCGGKTLLRSDDRRIIAKVGNGYQRRPASLLAMLAMSNIMPSYEMKVDGGIYTISNLIESEKVAVSKGMNLSMALVGLSFYGEARETWKNEMGETWSIEKMVVEELNRNIDQGSSDVTDWLLGLTAAINLYEEEGRALRGPMALAKRQIKTYQDFVLSVQNEHYLWHPKFFLFRGITPDAYEAAYSGGHVLRWLILSLPENQLSDIKVRRAVANLAATVNRIPANTPAGSLSDKQIEGIGVALHALSLYHQRVFGGNPLEEAPSESSDNSVAQR